jgi:ribosomal protein S18 acetylase RimI-like enzyme
MPAAMADDIPWKIRSMTLRDYPQVRRIWKETEGLCVIAEDSRAGISVYLRRNPGLCFVATSAGRVVGTVLCGHDGRRGILRHLAVVRAQRGRGIARALVAASLAGLRRQGVRRCDLYVEDGNRAARSFWRHLGFGLVRYNYRTLQGPTRP